MALTPIPSIPTAKVWYLVAALANGGEDVSSPMSKADCLERVVQQQWLVGLGDAFRIVDGVYWRVDDVWCRDSGGEELVGP